MGAPGSRRPSNPPSRGWHGSEMPRRSRTRDPRAGGTLPPSPVRKPAPTINEVETGGGLDAGRLAPRSADGAWSSEMADQGFGQIPRVPSLRWRGRTSPVPALLPPLLAVRILNDAADYLLPCLQADFGARVRVRSWRPSGHPSKELLVLCDVWPQAGHASDILRELESLPTSAGVRSATLGDDRVTLLLACRPPVIALRLFDRGGFCDYGPALGNCPPALPRSWEFVVSAHPRLMEECLSGQNPLSVQVRKAAPRADSQTENSLTGRQDLAVRFALDLGYLDCPRRADLGSVADALGVSRHAAMLLIRKGVRRLVRTYHSGDSRIGAVTDAPSLRDGPRLP